MRWIFLLLLAQDPDTELPRLELGDDRLTIELVAREPDIVTPPSLDVDGRGRIWALENNTHHRRPEYKGPPTDRVKIFEDFDASGRARKVTVYAEGFRLGTSLRLGKGGNVYVATRSKIFLLRDRSGDGKADTSERKLIVDMQTDTEYPHNGLAGLALSPTGMLYFTLGENYGVPYVMTGSDGKSLRGGGEGGSIYRCRPDGSGLERLATGVWNCFDLAFDAFGVLLAGDDDPGDRPPCRLLHVVPGANFGFQSRHHQNGASPLSSWNGEGPGTLPMISRVAQSPTGLVVYESDGLPADYRGDVIVTSWAEYVIQRYRRAPKGASFEIIGKPKTLVRGGNDFRPAGIVVAPDGSLLVSDWASRSYPVHGKGRIWRIRWKDRPALKRSLPTETTKGLLGHAHLPLRRAAAEALARKDGARLGETLRTAPDPRARIEVLWAAVRAQLPRTDVMLQQAASDRAWQIRGEAFRLMAERGASREILIPALDDPSPFVRMQAVLGLKDRVPLDGIRSLLKEKDPFLRSAAITAAGRPEMTEKLARLAEDKDARVRVGALLALQRSGTPEARRTLPRFIKDADPTVQRAAIQWIAEERLEEYIPLIDTVLSGRETPHELIDIYFAATKMLVDESILKRANNRDAREAIVRVFEDEAKPPALRASALRVLTPAPGTDRLKEFLKQPDASLRKEALRSISIGSDSSAPAALRAVAADTDLPVELRAEAVLGLAHTAATSEQTRKLLLSLLAGEDGGLRREAITALRPAVGRPEVREALLKRGSGDLTEAVWMTLRFDAAAKADPRFTELSKAAAKRPGTKEDWKDVLSAPGDAGAGERVFFNPNGTRCYACHRVDGRGGPLGPDLSRIGQARNLDKLIESILEPDKEIAPQFVGWLFALKNGDVVTARIREETGDLFRAITLERKYTVRKTELIRHQRYRASMMPSGLESALTRKQFRDLIAYLSSRK